MSEKVPIGILGSSGYLGEELIKLLSEEDWAEIIYTPSRDDINKGLNIPDNLKVVCLALPTKLAIALTPKFLEQGVRVIDLSGGFRLKNVHHYKKYYNFEHPFPKLLQEAVYGFPERYSFLIRHAKLVANPGCYSTAAELGMLPFLSIHTIPKNVSVVIDAVSGYSGAGKGAEIPKIVTEYKVGRKHRHVPEIEQELGLKNNLFFRPSIAPWERGIELMAHFKGKSSVDLIHLYKRFYRDDPLIRIRDQDTNLEDVVGTNFCDIYPKSEGDYIVIKVAIDNLLKGGAGQAVQNLKIMFNRKTL